MPFDKMRRFLWLSILAVIIGVGGVFSLRFFGRSSETALSDALVAVQIRDVHGIQMALRTLETDEKKPSEVIFLKGARSLFLNRPDLALRDFAAIEPEGSIRIPLMVLTGESLYRTGKLQDAERCLLQAVAEDPQNADAHRWLATVYYDLGAMSKALFHLNAVSEIQPDDFRPHRMRGVIYREFGQNDDAVAAYSRAAELAKAPTDLSEVLVSIASVQITRKEFEAALQSLEKCKESSSVLAIRAECWWNLGDLSRADEALSRAAELGDVPANGLRLRARMFIENKDPADAISILTGLLRDDASDDEAEYLLAMAYRLQNQDELATQHLQKSEWIKSLKVELTTLSQRAMENPDDPVVRDELATVCDKLGLTEMARIWRTAAAACRQISSEKKESP